MLKPVRLLILGCGGSPAVNFIKALRLSKKNYYIVGIDINRFFLEISPVDKKYYIRKIKSKKDYVNKIKNIIEKEKIDFVHAQPDNEVKIISDFRDYLPAKTFLPSKRAVNIFQDKWETYVELNKNKIPLPKTQLVINERILKKILQKNTKIFWLRARYGQGGKASLPIKTFDQALMWIRYWIHHGLSWKDFLISEFLPGVEVSWLSIWENGNLICSQQKERLGWVQGNISPSGVGGTTAIQKTSSYPDINKICTKTILSVDKNANGVYVVDVKQNNKGVFCVTEINPGRFFTTSLFFATAGLNMPDIFVEMGLGNSIPKVKQYNSLKNNIYWIRVTDGQTGIFLKNKWTSIALN